MQHRISTFIWMAATGLLLSGCASAPQKPTQSITLPQAQAEAERVLTPEELWAFHEKKLKHIHRWKMEGRIAATHGQEGGNASFVWKQTGDHYQIRFFGPFGAGSVYVTGSPNQVSVIDGNGKHHQAKTAEELMQKVAGWQLPLSGIRYWMLGLPNPQAAVSGKLLNQKGHLSQLTQSNWTVNYDRYNLTTYPAIPAKIHMHNHNYKVKLIIKDWSVSG